jgi:hypothetical protein
MNTYHAQYARCFDEVDFEPPVFIHGHALLNAEKTLTHEKPLDKSFYGE